MPKTSTTGYKENRRLRSMVDELKIMEEELNPGLRKKNQEELANLKKSDPFGRQRYEVEQVLVELDQDSKDLKQMHKSGKKDRTSIALAQKCRKNLVRCDQEMQALQTVLKALVKKAKGNKEMTPEQWKSLKTKNQVLEALKLQQFQIAMSLSTAPAEEKTALVAKQKEQIAKSNQQTKTIEQESTKTDRNDRKSRRAAREKKKQQKHQTQDVGDSDIQLTVMSDEQERAEAEIGLEREAQNKMLDQIGKGISELQNIADEMFSNFEKQAAYAAEIEEQMSLCQEKLDSANEKLVYLNAAGDDAMSRWCPRMVCLLVLLSLGGYAYYLMTA